MSSNKLFIGNLPYQATERDLEQLFSSCGEIVNVHIPIDRESGKPRGFAFVEMATVIEAVDAIHQFNGVNLGGRDISVVEAVEKDVSTPSKPYAKEIGTGDCILCNTTATLYGFDSSLNTHGVCTTCIASLSKASRPPRKQKSFMRSSNYGENRTIKNRY
jgi:RNA recognition motif-containing protein